MFVINKEKLKKNKLKYHRFSKTTVIFLLFTVSVVINIKYSKKKINCDIKNSWFN